MGRMSVLRWAGSDFLSLVRVLWDKENMAHEWQEKARKLAAEGASWNSIARRLNVGRASVQRFLKSLGVKKTASAEARALLTIRHEKLAGNLDEALSAAYSLRGVAEQKMDSKMLVAANKQIARILAMQSKGLPRLPTPVDIPVGLKFAVNPEICWPDDTDDELIQKFGGRRMSEVGKDPKPSVPTIRFRVQWQDSETSPFDQPLAEAQHSSPDEVEATMRLAAEIEGATTDAEPE